VKADAPVPSPSGRRWREAPDEGVAGRERSRDFNTLTPAPLPEGEGIPTAANPFKIEGACQLRGDYRQCAADYTVRQDYALYTDADHALWRRLYARQAKLIESYAAPEFIAGVAALNMADEIPHFDRANDMLARATGFELVAVPGLIPNDVFFGHLAQRRFPVSVWLRREDEFDYLVEPDIFHDFFGHVPLLSNPVFADYLQSYGEQGRVAIGLDAVEPMSRLYWYMVEFGLIKTPYGLRAFGAGILSSGGETIYCVDSPQPLRIGFDAERVMQTAYRIDAYQQTYFVVDSFEQLFSQTRGDLSAALLRARHAPAIPATETRAGDRVIAL
jgi:phenylalanine-4-hydroxylase